MRILNLQNAVIVSLLATAFVGSACSSSDSPRPTGTAGAGTAGANSTAGAGGDGSAGTPAGGAVSGGGSGSAGTPGGAGTAGGDGTAGGAADTGVCSGLGSRVLTATAADAFIDDFETEQMNPTTMMLDPTKAAAGWYGFNDITPPNSVQLLRAAGGAATTMFSGHYAGMGAKTPVAGGYGVGVEINVGVAKDLTPPQYCVDASAFTGVSFWAKAASATNAKISAGFVVPSQNQVMNNGDCPDTAAAAKCNNYPQKNFVLTTEWTQYTVTFAEVTGSTGAKVVGGKVQQILFLAPTANWDFSIDEVAFYSGTAPKGPVAVPPAAM